MPFPAVLTVIMAEQTRSFNPKIICCLTSTIYLPDNHMISKSSQIHIPIFRRGKRRKAIVSIDSHNKPNTNKLPNLMVLKGRFALVVSWVLF